jgi:hypothetical protein
MDLFSFSFLKRRMGAPTESQSVDPTIAIIKRLGVAVVIEDYLSD